MDDSVLIEKAGKVAVVKLNEPASLNALSLSLKNALLDALDQLHRDPDVTALVVAGNGRAFCAGGDIRAMSGNVTVLQGKERMEDAARIVQMLTSMKKPVVAAVHGYAVGAGFSIALACDLVVAEEGTKFGLAFKNIGLIPDLGLHYFLLQAVPPWKAKEWIWSGAMIPAEDGYRYGFVNRLAPSGQGLETALAMARELAEGPLQAYKLTKSILHKAVNMRLDDVLELENFGQAAVRQTGDHREGVAAFREKRPPRFKGE